MSELTRTFVLTIYVNGQPFEVVAKFKRNEKGLWENMFPIIFPPINEEPNEPVYSLHPVAEP